MLAVVLPVPSTVGAPAFSSRPRTEFGGADLGKPSGTGRHRAERASRPERRDSGRL